VPQRRSNNISRARESPQNNRRKTLPISELRKHLA
jgi:hypothetical protein